ncbi:MAG: DUF4064 domain-containing protein [Thermoflavifilum sp.]|nr:DUF4064 domain-containing protein [Thermoflavifilum sp.]MCL6514813.1 hypothetical protein [Alicyclobacillus sp.]
MKRTLELVLGLIGGIIGFFMSLFAQFFGAVDKALNGSSEVSHLGVAAMLLSLLGIVGSIVVRFRAKLGGIIMLVAGVGVVISISLFGILPGLLLAIAGLLGLFRKPNRTIAA